MKYAIGKKEAEHKFETIDRLIQLKKEFDLKTENVVYMITEVIVNGLEQQQATEQEELHGEPIKDLIEKGTTKFDKRFELIGQLAKKNHSLAKFVDNPYKVPVNHYDRCKRCGKVGITALVVNRESDPPRTSIYQVWHHEKGQHSITVETFAKKLEWEEILAKAGTGKKTKMYKSKGGGQKD